MHHLRSLPSPYHCLHEKCYPVQDMFVLNLVITTESFFFNPGGVGKWAPKQRKRTLWPFAPTAIFHNGSRPHQERVLEKTVARPRWSLRRRKKKSGPGVVFSVIFFGVGCVIVTCQSQKIRQKKYAKKYAWQHLRSPCKVVNFLSAFPCFGSFGMFFFLPRSGLGQCMDGQFGPSEDWFFNRPNPLKLYEPKPASFRLASTWRRSGAIGALGPWYECGQVWLVYVWYILKEYFTVCANLPSCTTLHSTSR